ncbi:ROK family protein [Lutibacter sp. A80]|uniref:ROK family protein n=1 Tax=Lutibacter sp. A80 TaxID=2918453 RepID=UPI001F0573B5|nr:ROK family protein [Lutibacter sp. A80]UMB62174.1 ROK family protein [Lutibacter sp. A80]
MNKNRYSIGCDIGGSHISCAIIGVDTGVVLENSLINIKVENSESKEVLIAAWTKAIAMCKENLPDNSEFLGVGLAIPGPFDYEKGIGLFDNSNQKFVDLINVNVKEALSESLALPQDQIRFVNDATAFSLGCFWYGSGKGNNKMVAITLGTGFGSSFISEGEAIEEGTTVPENGYLWDKPFKEGIADDYFSTRWFVNSFNELSKEEVTGVKRIAELATSGNQEAISLFNNFGKNLADCLAEHLINFSADVVVMGGNIAEAFELFKPSLYSELKEKGVQIPFKVSVLKESAAMLGAVTLFK